MPTKALAVPAIVGPRQEPPLDEEDLRRRRDAADKVWQELIKGVSRGAEDANPKRTRKP